MHEMLMRDCTLFALLPNAFWGNSFYLLHFAESSLQQTANDLIPCHAHSSLTPTVANNAASFYLKLETSYFNAKNNFQI